MHEIDQERFGAFVAQLRKEKGVTQKELAEKLFVSDKAVSKWERGLSIPDVALLLPLSAQLGVTVTELLSGQRIPEPEHLNVRQVEELMTGAIRLSAREERVRGEGLRKTGILYAACAVLALLEIAVLRWLGFSFAEMSSDVLLVEGLCLVFGAWFCFFVKETLPAYYDENKISFYTDGIFRMNLAGIRFNNSNWPHILRAGRTWLLGTAVAYPILYGVMQTLLPDAGIAVKLATTLVPVLGMFIPMMIVGKRYE